MGPKLVGQLPRDAEVGADVVEYGMRVAESGVLDTNRLAEELLVKKEANLQADEPLVTAHSAKGCDIPHLDLLLDALWRFGVFGTRAGRCLTCIARLNVIFHW